MSYFDRTSIEARFGDLATSKKVGKGTFLFRQGQPVDFVYFIDMGRVTAESYSASEESLVLYTATAGMALGEEHIFMERYGYSAMAEEEVEVRALRKLEILKQLKNDPLYASQFMMCISSRYNELRVVCTLLTIRRAEDRLLAYLKWRAAQEGPAINLQGRMGQLGMMLNLTKESIYRAMGALEERGKITRKNGLIAIH